MDVKFEVDKQTLRDLEIFDTFKNGKSIFNLFNFTRSLEGKRRLYSVLSSPMSNIDEITERRDAIAFFQENVPAGMYVDKNALDFSEYYLKHGDYPTRMPSRFSAIEKKLMSYINQSPEYYLIEKGVTSTVDLLNDIYRFALVLAEKLKDKDYPKLLSRNNKEILRLFSKPEYSELIGLKKVKAFDISRLDYMFRYTHRRDIAFLHNLVYEYDMFYAVTKAAEKYNLTYPELLPDSETTLELDGIFHPFIEDGIPNDIHFSKSSNLLFITGPNMAGKSTFLKALGVSVYLAHIGFPVPAKKMSLSVLSGLCTTINMSDNLSSGYSHFYAEVMRVKNVAERLKTNRNMLVLFDELFRGTNVKDAYDGTLAVVSAFAEIHSSFFVVSTHIVEVARELQNDTNINFCYFEIVQKEGHPVYTYKLKDGVSDVRLGMYIIQKEGLIELINNIKQTDHK